MSRSASREPQLLALGDVAAAAIGKIHLAETYASDGAFFTAANLCSEAAAMFQSVAEQRQKAIEALTSGGLLANSSSKPNRRKKA